jgi:hypothetical protein
MMEMGVADELQRRPLRVTRRLCPPQGMIQADPFVLDVAGRRWLLFEELQCSNNRGYIAAMAMHGTEVQKQECKVVLVEPWHLSFPFVWREGDDLYLLPEANESRKLTAYKILDGDLNLRPCEPLITGIRLADANIIRYEGRLWLFAAAADHGASLNDALHVYWAEHVEGPWRTHKLNPVKVDASSARPAGEMWVEDGHVHRVVQDCSSTYGGSVRCMRVTLLTDDGFEEQEVPGWSSALNAGAGPWHTFNCAGELMVTDRLVATPRWRS